MCGFTSHNIVNKQVRTHRKFQIFYVYLYKVLQSFDTLFLCIDGSTDSLNATDKTSTAVGDQSESPPEYHAVVNDVPITNSTNSYLYPQTELRPMTDGGGQHNVTVVVTQVSCWLH